MSESLSFNCEWIDQPGAQDSLERATWARINIGVEGRYVTRVWDRERRIERSGIYVPAYPIARWLVQNWWTLFFETTPSDRLPLASNPLPEEQRSWVRRHCLRSAESGFLLPKLYIYQSGDEVCLQWLSDDRDSYKQMPGVFLDSGIERLERSSVEGALEEFVSSVTTRLTESLDVRAKNLISDWAAIQISDNEEKEFCSFAGRMGLDPYDLDAWPSGLVHLFEREIGPEKNIPLRNDFLDASTPSRSVALWEWVKNSKSMYKMADPTSTFSSQFEPRSPAASGYGLATKMRAQINLGDKPVDSVPVVSKKLMHQRLVFKNHNHLPEPKVKAIAGFDSHEQFQIVGAVPAISENKRFLEARGLYFALKSPHLGPRLITDAHSWDQQASRAFAAELLAPANAILNRLDRSNDSGQNANVALLSKHFKVSTRVIELQLENSNIDLQDF